MRFTSLPELELLVLRKDGRFENGLGQTVTKENIGVPVRVQVPLKESTVPCPLAIRLRCEHGADAFYEIISTRVPGSEQAYTAQIQYCRIFEREE